MHSRYMVMISWYGIRMHNEMPKSNDLMWNSRMITCSPSDIGGKLNMTNIKVAKCCLK
jgi:hypothetical protein